MGCGCAKRKKRLADCLERKGQPTLARTVRNLPTPEDAANLARRLGRPLRTVLRGAPDPPPPDTEPDR